MKTVDKPATWHRDHHASLVRLEANSGGGGHGADGCSGAGSGRD